MHKAVFRSGLVLAGLVGACLLVVALTQCTEVGRVSGDNESASSPNAVARLTLLNDSPCEWQIVFTPVAGGEPRAWKLSVDQSLEVELGGGDYVVEQTMLADDAGPDATRRFSMRFETGQIYRWRLITLLSGAADDVLKPAARSNEHE